MQYQRSSSLFKEAQAVIPGGVNSPVRAFKSVGGTPIFVERAKGAYLYDADGNKLIDYISSWGPMILGHAFTPVIDAVKQRADKGTSFGMPTEIETKIAELISLIPKEFVLNDNYPNPFNPITTIKYEIPNDGKVLLVIYNLLGQEVITLINNEQWAGKYSVRWNGTNQFGNQVSTGTYFYFLKTQNNQSVKKMLLLK